MLSQVSSSVSRSSSEPVAGFEPGQDLGHPVRALTARGALAAGLVRVELREPQAGLDHADRLVHDHDGSGAEQRSGGDDAFEVHRAYRGGRPSASACSIRPGSRPSAWSRPRMPPAISSRVPNVVPSGTSYWPGTFDVATDRDHLRAGRLLGAHRAEPLDALAHDPRDGGDRFDVVDHGRRLVEAVRRRERADAAAADRGSPRASRVGPSPHRRCRHRRRGAGSA